jgi:hypothetical protein
MIRCGEALAVYATKNAVSVYEMYKISIISRPAFSPPSKD